jgi:hypothetical protein
MHCVAWLGLWVKVKCLHREEFVVVGWTRSRRLPAMARRAAARLLTTPTGGWSTPAAPAPASSRRSWNGCGDACNRFLSTRCPSRCRPPRTSRFGSPLVLSQVHWVRPELVAEVKYLTWTDDNLLWQVVYEGLREDKPAAEVRRPGRSGSAPLQPAWEKSSTWTIVDRCRLIFRTIGNPQRDRRSENPGLPRRGFLSPSPPPALAVVFMRRRPRGARRLSGRRADSPHCARRASPPAPLHQGARAYAGPIHRLPAGSPRRGPAGRNRLASCSGSGGRPRTSTR